MPSISLNVLTKNHQLMNTLPELKKLLSTSKAIFVICSILFLSIILYSCKNTKDALNENKKVINQTYSNIKFTPSQLEKVLAKTINITLIPIDAKSLNKETFEAAERDGSYEKERASVLEKRRKEINSKLTKAEKNTLMGIINALELIEKYYKKGLISSKSAFLLSQIIELEGSYSGKDGSEISSLSELESYPDSYNPYKVHQRYFSVIKIIYQNLGTEVNKINLKDIQVISGEELLYPLSIDYFENNLIDEPEKIKNAYRMNHPEELVLTPGQKVVKFVSIPALNLQNPKLKIEYIKGSEILQFDFLVNEFKTNKTFTFDGYTLFAKGINSPDIYSYKFVLEYDNGTIYPLSGNKVYVSDENSQKLVSVYGIAINKLNSTVLVGRKTNFKFTEVEKNNLVIPFE